MTQEEMKKEFRALYEKMANSNDVTPMHIFGKVQQEMMEWFITYKPELAQEWIDKLETIKWHNYLTKKEAQQIVDNMQPQAPWSYEQWKQAMTMHQYQTEEEPYYNSCALWVTMNMKMSDSSNTLKKYVDDNTLFELVHALAIDSLKDKDGVFNIRKYFGL
jgi:hypothetical protein